MDAVSQSPRFIDWLKVIRGTQWRAFTSKKIAALPYIRNCNYSCIQCNVWVQNEKKINLSIVVFCTLQLNRNRRMDHIQVNGQIYDGYLGPGNRRPQDHRSTITPNPMDSHFRELIVSLSSMYTLVCPIVTNELFDQEPGTDADVNTSTNAGTETDTTPIVATDEKREARKETYV